MIVPPFARESTKSDGKRRALASGVSLSDIDVTRDIIDLHFHLKSDIDVKKIRYTLEIAKWSEKEFQIHINFTNPLFISQGQERDEIVLIVKNPSWFRSALTGNPIDANLGKIAATLPRQLPVGVEE